MSCRVGTGVNDAERKTLADRLNPLFVDNVKGRNCVPRCYRTTGMPKERPDVWIKDPTRSIVLQVMQRHCLHTACLFLQLLMASNKEVDTVIARTPICIMMPDSYGLCAFYVDH